MHPYIGYDPQLIKGVINRLPQQHWQQSVTVTSGQSRKSGLTTSPMWLSMSKCPGFASLKAIKSPDNQTVLKGPPR